jgi:hypothetical protein
MTTTQLDPRLQLAVNMGVSGTDILHGELKNRMLEAETKLERCDQDDEREWLDGYMEALTDIYKLTYDLSFAISDRRKKYA